MWLLRLGYIERESTGYRLELDEADVAYCASIYAEKYAEYGGRLQGVNIFDKDGNPYEVKEPEFNNLCSMSFRGA